MSGATAPAGQGCAVSPSRAAAGSAALRIRAMIGSILATAMARPSRIWARSRALPRRCAVRRVITSSRKVTKAPIMSRSVICSGRAPLSVNMLALNGARPEQMTLRDMIGAFVTFREEVITRRTAHLLGKARERAHILLGLAIAVANIDPIIALIRNAADPAAAREGLTAQPWPAGAVAPLIALVGEPGHSVAEDGTYRLSEEQARAILDLRLQRLTGLEREKIAEELNGIIKEIDEYLEILRSRPRLLEIM